MRECVLAPDEDVLYLSGGESKHFLPSLFHRNPLCFHGGVGHMSGKLGGHEVRTHFLSPQLHSFDLLRLLYHKGAGRRLVAVIGITA